VLRERKAHKELRGHKELQALEHKVLKALKVR
jgi:hypothetical protein